MSSASHMRQVFAQIIMFNEVTNPLGLWHRFKESMSEDFAHRREAFFDEDEQGEWSWEALLHIQRLLEEGGKTLEEFHLPVPPAHVRRDEVTEELRRNGLFDYHDLQDKIELLNVEQLEAYQQVMTAVQDADGTNSMDARVFFLDGIGGAGKTFLYDCLLSTVREGGNISLAVASTGLASLLLPNAVTAHKRFKLPVANILTPEASCNINKESEQADLIRKAKLIVWDEAPTMHRYHFEAVDRCLRDICGEMDKPFGGKVVVLWGDFRQCLPVIKRASRPEVVSAALSRASFWPGVKVLRLHQNMRVATMRQGGDENRAHQLQQWSDLLKRIGEGQEQRVGEGPYAGWISLPPKVNFQGKTPEEFLTHAYGRYSRLSSSDQKTQFLKETAILTTTNALADSINERLLTGPYLGPEMEAAEIKTYRSIDTLIQWKKRTSSMTTTKSTSTPSKPLASLSIPSG